MKKPTQSSPATRPSTLTPGKKLLLGLQHMFAMFGATILVCGLGFGDGLTFQVGSASITLTALAIAAIIGILLNAVLPGNDYEFGVSQSGDAHQGVHI